MNFNFGEVLSRAWQIIWKHKVLWIFGVFAGCSRGGSNFNSNSNSGGGNGGGFDNVDIPPQVQQFFQDVAENMTMYIVIAITLFCVIWLVMIFLGTIGRIGLIRGTWQVEGGAEQLIFGELFSESTPFFWRIFGLSLLAALPIFIVVALVIVMMVPTLAASGGGDAAAAGALGSMTLFCGCMCLLIPVMIVIGLVVRQAENAIVLEDMGIMPSISRGWEVFRNNLGVMILMTIILGVIGLIVGFVISIPIFVVVLPAVFTFAAGQGQDWTPMIFMGVCLCLYIPVTWLLNGVLMAYTESAWTLTYMRLTKPQSNAPVVLEANA